MNRYQTTEPHSNNSASFLPSRRTHARRQNETFFSMLARIGRIIASLFGAAGVAAAPVKSIAAVVLSMIIPYLLYAFLGGFGIALAIAGIGWAIWYFARKK